MIAIILGLSSTCPKKILPADQLVTFETGVRYPNVPCVVLIFISMITGLSHKTKK
jgi:hypothetical protein